jgi:hypothetical protein
VVDRRTWNAYIPVMKFVRTDAMSSSVREEALAIDKLVLATVNAPYKRTISAASLTECLAKAEFGSWPVHVATFFTDVAPDLVFRFAAAHGISKSELANAYLGMKAQTGERHPALEAELVPVGTATS